MEQWAEFNPQDVAVDSAGNLLIADTANRCIRRVNAATGLISTVAGTGGISGFQGDGGSATSARLAKPAGVAVDLDGNFFIADTGNNRVRRVDAVTGIITTYASGGASLGDGGAASLAQLLAPNDVVLDMQRNVYIADTGNFRIRKVDALTGVITTVAGNGLAGFTGNGSAATLARIGTVKGAAVDYAGNLYFSDVFDASNHRVRMVSSPAGLISTFAGLGPVGSTGDGGIATSARLSSPHSVVVDAGGKVQISDSGNHRIRAEK